MKFALITMPARAHLNPTLGIVKELVKLGHEVIVYNSPEFATEITASGAKFRSPVKELPGLPAEIGQDALVLAEFLLDLTPQLIQPLLTDVISQQPDCVLHDSLNLWGKLIAQKTKIPSICLVPTMVLTPRLIFSSIRDIYPDFLRALSQPLKLIQLNQKYSSLYRQWQLQPPLISDLFINKESLNLVFTSREFQPNGITFGSEYKFVGPMIYKREQKPTKLADSDQPIVLISLGTVYNQRLDFYRNWLKLFQHSNYQVYMSVGKNIDQTTLGKIPENIIVADYLPQLEILAKAALFITHGGMNSVNESLYYGVPMLLFPQIQEQKINSARVVELGAGIWSKSTTFDPFQMSDLVEKLIHDPIYKNNALKIGQTLRQAGGIEAAVSSILGYAGQ